MIGEPEKMRGMTDALTPEGVCAYLREHPDFLVRHAEVIEHLTLPAVDHGPGVVDLLPFMVERLRGEQRTLKEQQRALIATTHANTDNQNRTHTAVLALLDAGSFERLIQLIAIDLAALLDLDFAGLVFESNGGNFSHHNGVCMVDPGTISRWLGAHDVVLNAAIQGAPEVYGPSADRVRSEALVRLWCGESLRGLLVLGSHQPDMFHNSQGTELLRFLAHVIERCIRSWLDHG